MPKKKCNILQTKTSNKLSDFPKKTNGKIVSYNNNSLQMPIKILEMGLLPGTEIQILYQAPFGGPLYLEYGDDKTRVALREEEAKFINVEALT